MFARYCDFCNREQKCHNTDDGLYCINCKQYIEPAPEQANEYTVT